LILDGRFRSRLQRRVDWSDCRGSHSARRAHRPCVGLWAENRSGLSAHSCLGGSQRPFRKPDVLISETLLKKEVEEERKRKRKKKPSGSVAAGPRASFCVVLLLPSRHLQPALPPPVRRRPRAASAWRLLLLPRLGRGGWWIPVPRSPADAPLGGPRPRARQFSRLLLQLPPAGRQRLARPRLL
jgi:hypothetical protein